MASKKEQSDQDSGEEVGAYLRSLREASGKTVIEIAHSPPERGAIFVLDNLYFFNTMRLKLFNSTGATEPPTPRPRHSRRERTVLWHMQPRCLGYLEKELIG